MQIFNTTEISRACPRAQCNFAFYGGNGLYYRYISTFQIFNLFVFLWLINFVIALGQCALAGAFASYYWALRKPDDIPPYPLFTAFGRAIRWAPRLFSMFNALIIQSWAYHSSVKVQVSSKVWFKIHGCSLALSGFIATTLYSLPRPLFPFF